MGLIEKRHYYLFRQLIPHLRESRKPLIIAGFLTTATVLLQLPMPFLTRYVIDEVLTGRNFALLHWIALGLLGLSVVSIVCGFSNYYLIAVARERVTRSIQVRLFEHLERLCMSFYDRQKVGYVLARVSSDVGSLQGLFADRIVGFALDFLTFAVGVTVLIAFHTKLALVTIALLPLFLYSLHFFSGRLRSISETTQEHIGRTMGVLSESLSGIRVVKAYGIEKTQSLKVVRQLHKMVRAKLHLSFLSSLSGYLSGFIGGLGPVVVLWYGGYEVMQGRLSLGTLVAFNAFLAYLFGPVQRLMSFNSELQSSLASLSRVVELLEMPTEKQRDCGNTKLRSVQGRIQFENIIFSYDGSSTVLSGIDFDVDPGTKVALVGRSGSGKTTLINLLMRFYQVQRGRILLDGTPIDQIELSNYRSYFGIVTQDPFLFGGSIIDNIAVGNQRATATEIQEAAELANAHEFIVRMPHGYRTEIGERGVRLSGGQRQRIAIARAILRNPHILVLDEATSEVDSESESVIQEALKRLLLNRTALVIAHRLATVKSADRIVALDDGRIVGMGVHAEMYANCSIYRRLYLRQFAA